MKKTFLLIFIISHLLNSYELVTSKTNCNFYLAIEEEKNCSNYSNYLKDYGFKYCNLFLKAKNNWPIELQIWVQETALCLQNKLLEYHLENGYLHSEQYCSKIEDVAFSSHPECYKQNGFSRLSIENQFKIISQLSTLDIMLKPKQTLQQAILVAIDCANEKCILM